VTSAADCTVKLWDAETRKAVTTWTVGSGVDYHQIGNTWNDDINIVSLSLSGDLSVFDPRVGDKPTQVYSAPQKAVNSIIATKGQSTFIAGTADGRVYSYSVADGRSSVLGGQGHPAFLTGIAAASSDVAYSIGYDDHVREIDTKSDSYLYASLLVLVESELLADRKPDILLALLLSRQPLNLNPSLPLRMGRYSSPRSMSSKPSARTRKSRNSNQSTHLAPSLPAARQSLLGPRIIRRICTTGLGRTSPRSGPWRPTLLPSLSLRSPQMVL
jgi:WD40 repeat protein